MAVRTTPEYVRAVMMRDYDSLSNPVLDPFVRAAARVVDRLVTRAADSDITISDDEARDVETWLAAHLYTQSDRPYASRSTQGASASFQGQTGMGLDSSFYGQTAKILDPSGMLASVTAATGVTTATGWWFGTASDAQTDYDG